MAVSEKASHKSITDGLANPNFMQIVTFATEPDRNHTVFVHRQPQYRYTTAYDIISGDDGIEHLENPVPVAWEVMAGKASVLPATAMFPESGWISFFSRLDSEGADGLAGSS